MRKIFLLGASVLMSAAMMATDWSSIAWVTDAAGDGAYANKYKVDAAFGMNVTTVQDPFGTGVGIYCYFNAAIESCTLEDSQCDIRGAGILMFLSAFTQKETSLSIVAGGSTYACKVYFEDGEGEVSEDPEPVAPGEGDLTPATFYGVSTTTIGEEEVTFNWSITRNADATLTFEITWEADIEGAVPQLCLEGSYLTMPYQNKRAILTTQDAFEEGAAINAFFYIAYTGNAAHLDIVGYTVGAENERPETPEEPTDPTDPTDPPDPEDPEDPGDGIEEVIANPTLQGHKLLLNGHVVIRRGDHLFDAQGAVIR